MLRVQLLNKHRAEEDYASSRVSVDKRQVPWLLSPAERKALPIGVLRKLRQLEREEDRARKQLPGSISKLVKGYELRMWWFEVSSDLSNRLPQNFQTTPRVLAPSVRYSSAFGSSPWHVCPSSSSRRDLLRSSPLV